MPVLLNTSQYLENTNDADWLDTGTLFVRINPQFTINDGLIHCFLSKTPLPFSLQLFNFSKVAANAIEIGLYVIGSDYRLTIPTAASWIATNTWANHIFSWSLPTPETSYYVNNTLAGTSAAPFSMPNITTVRRCFGNIDVGSIAQPADSYLAEHGRWSRVLTAAERQILQVTGCPLFVPNGLLEYYPLSRDAGAGRDLFGRTPMTTVGGTLTDTLSEPYIIRPQSAYIVPAPPHPVTVSPPLVSNAFQLFAPAITFGIGVQPPVVSNSFQLFAPAVTTDLGFQVPLLSNPLTIYAPTITIQETTIQDDTRTLEPHNLKVRIVDFVAGDDLRITRTYTELAEGIFITRGYLTIKRRAVDDNDAEAIIQKTITSTDQMSGKITDDNTTGGSIHLYFDLSHTDTALLTPLIPYHYDIQVHTVSNAIYTCEKGVIVMAQGVTEATA